RLDGLRFCDKAGEAQPCRRADAAVPIEHHPRALSFLRQRSLGADEPRNIRLEHLTVFVVHAVVPSAQKLADDLRRAGWVVAPPLAGNERNGLHHAHLSVGLVRAMEQGKAVEKRPQRLATERLASYRGHFSFPLMSAAPGRSERSACCCRECFPRRSR